MLPCSLKGFTGSDARLLRCTFHSILGLTLHPMLYTTNLLHGKEIIKIQETLDTRRCRLLIYIRNHDPTTLFSWLDAQHKSMYIYFSRLPRKSIRVAFFGPKPPLQTSTSLICTFCSSRNVSLSLERSFSRLEQDSLIDSNLALQKSRMDSILWSECEKRASTCARKRFEKIFRFQSQEELHHRKLSKILPKSY